MTFNCKICFFLLLNFVLFLPLLATSNLTCDLLAGIYILEVLGSHATLIM